MGNSLGHRSFSDAGGSVSGNFPFGCDDFGGDVWGFIEIGGGGLFFSAGGSHFTGGVRAEFFSATEGRGSSASRGVDASRFGFCRFRGHGLFRRSVVAGICANENIQSVWVVSDWSGADLVGLS